VVRHTPVSVALAAVKQLRPKQWFKQVFLLPALAFSGQFLQPGPIVSVAVGVAAFSLLSSSGYILNDWLDREADARHPKKKHRPIASGALPVPVALAEMAGALLGGLALAWLLGVPFFVSAVCYLVTTLSYSFYFKHIVILDVMFLALCYVWRVVGGAARDPGEGVGLAVPVHRVRGAVLRLQQAAGASSSSLGTRRERARTSSSTTAGCWRSSSPSSPATPCCATPCTPCSVRRRG
jgi:hypothetical protein